MPVSIFSDDRRYMRPRKANVRNRNNAIGPMAGSGPPGKVRMAPPYISGGLISLASSVTATETFASLFKFSPALRAPHYGLIYQPFAIFPWALRYHDIYQREYVLSTAAGAATFLLGAAAIAGWRRAAQAKESANPILHGSAQWQCYEGLKEASLVNNDGVYVGGWVDPDSKRFVFLRHNGPEHVMTIAPTRSGKGVGLVIPTLLSWAHSAVVFDLKGELDALTSGQRAKSLGNIVQRFEPAAPKGSARWNMFDEIRVGAEYEVADVQNMVGLMLDSSSKNDDETAAHFRETAAALLEGVILHALYRRRAGVMKPLLDAEMKPVPVLLEEDTEFNVFQPKRAPVSGTLDQPRFAPRTFRKGTPRPKLGDDGAVHFKPEDQAVKVYATRIVPNPEPVRTRDGEIDERFATVTVIDPDSVRTEWVNFDYETVKFFAPAARASGREIDRLLTDPERDIGELWDEMLTFEHYDKPHPDGVGKNRRTHDVVAKAARAVKDTDEVERAGVISTARRFFKLYRDPIVARNTEVSDFKIEDLMYSQSPMSLYIITQPTDQDRLKPLIRIMLDMMVRRLAPKQLFEEGRAVAYYNHRLLFMIDEFPALGKMEIMQKQLAWVAGYGMKFYLICQDITQLESEDEGYGRAELITSNCHIRNYYPPNKLETAEHISKLCGETTVLTPNVTVSRQVHGLGKGDSVSTSIKEEKRWLKSPDEIMRMKGARKDANGNIIEAGEMLIYATGHPMALGRQILYWEVPVFKAAASLPPAPPEIFDRVPWWDAEGKQRSTLMRKAEAKTLRAALLTNPKTVAPPIGKRASWFPPQGTREDEGEAA